MPTSVSPTSLVEPEDEALAGDVAVGHQPGAIRASFNSGPLAPPAAYGRGRRRLRNDRRPWSDVSAPVRRRPAVGEPARRRTRTLARMSATNAYPAEWESDVVLTDGGTAHLRPILPSDADALREPARTPVAGVDLPPVLHAAPGAVNHTEIERFTQVDYNDRMALIAELDDQMVTVAAMTATQGTAPRRRWPSPSSRRPWGEGSRHDPARAPGGDRPRPRHHPLRRRDAAADRRMRDLFHAAGFKDAASFTEGVVHVVFPSSRPSRRKRRCTTANDRHRLDR